MTLAFYLQTLTRRRPGARATTPLLLGVDDPSFVASSQTLNPGQNSATPDIQADASDSAMPVRLVSAIRF